MIKFYEGPDSPDILFVGDFPNYAEQLSYRTFSNKAGDDLRRAINAAGINFFRCGFTYAMLRNPKENKITEVCVKKAETGVGYPYEPFAQGKYIPRDWADAAHVHLREVVAKHKPRIIVALGSVAAWLTIGSSSINARRGYIFPDALYGPTIATYSFTQIQKAWDLRPIAITDFQKALRFVNGEYKQPVRYLTVDPTFEEVEDFIYTKILDVAETIRWLSYDIETSQGQITCIGFAPNPYEAICIPFFDPGKLPDKNFWPTLELEIKVRSLVKLVLESSIPKVTQNGLYDVQYCRRDGWSPRNMIYDTMIKHHSLFPEMDKGLGFLSSIYTDEQPWKMLRNRNRDALKAED